MNRFHRELVTERGWTGTRIHVPLVADELRYFGSCQRLGSDVYTVRSRHGRGQSVVCVRTFNENHLPGCDPTRTRLLFFEHAAEAIELLSRPPNNSYPWVRLAAQAVLEIACCATHYRWHDLPEIPQP